MYVRMYVCIYTVTICMYIGPGGSGGGSNSRTRIGITGAFEHAYFPYRKILNNDSELTFL
jgi:hypothetical protein